MRRPLAILLAGALSLLSAERSFTLEGVEFAWRAPAKASPEARIVVLFGGRDWRGGQAIRAFGFADVADRHGAFLLAPSFRGKDYWEPWHGTGALLLKAVAELERCHGLRPRPLLLYGYSAGGQCAAHFAAWLPPARVAGWGAHACGYYPEGATRLPALVTCGIDDFDRVLISRAYVARCRRSGAEVLWRSFRGGHELQPDALALARAWMDAMLAGPPAAPEYGEDDTRQIGGAIGREFRNPLYTPEVRRLWRGEGN